MAFPLYNNAALAGAMSSPVAVDLTGVTSVCPADERSHWLTLSVLLDEALIAQADEIHLEPENDCLRLRLRSAFSFDEVRVEQADEYLASFTLLQRHLWKGASPVNARRGWFSYSLRSGPRLLQLDAVPTSRGDTFVLTLLHELKTPPARLEELALSRTQQLQIRDVLKQQYGLLVIASQHAQARAQTARALAQELVSPERKIACADSPGHPPLPRVMQLTMDTLTHPEQRQIWPAVCELGCDAIVAWQSSCDEMTRRLARQAAESTLVVQGVGVNSAADAVDHLLAMGVRSETLARSLSAIVVQRRLQCLCPYCRGPHAPDDEGTAWLAEYSPIKAGNINDWLRHRMRASFSSAKGCERCHHTGRGDTRDLFAFVTLDDDVRDALYDTDIRFALTRLREIQPMARDLLRLAQEGIITLSEAARIAPLKHPLHTTVSR